MKRIKKQKMKDIIKAMEAFNENLVGGKRLVKALERDTPIGTMGIHLISISMIIYKYIFVCAHPGGEPRAFYVLCKPALTC